MRLKSFSAATTAEAMEQVRNELGPDAVILASETENGTVRVIAALDAPVPPADQPKDTPPSSHAAGGDDLLARVLVYHGMPAAVTAALAAGATGPDLTATLALRLENSFRFANLADRHGDEAPLLLAGLPGAGKTLAAAKLAARAVMAGQPVRLITTDIGSAGAADQIAAFAAPLKLVVETADTPPRLAALVAKRQAPGTLTLIDMRGFNPFDDAEIENLKTFVAAARAEPVFVLAAGGDASDAAEQAAAFAAIGCRRLLSTRVDLARRLGGILSAALGGNLALSEASASPVIADGLHPLSPLLLARLLAADGATVRSEPAARS